MVGFFAFNDFFYFPAQKKRHPVFGIKNIGQIKKELRVHNCNRKTILDKVLGNFFGGLGNPAGLMPKIRGNDNFFHGRADINFSILYVPIFSISINPCMAISAKSPAGSKSNSHWSVYFGFSCKVAEPVCISHRRLKSSWDPMDGSMIMGIPRPE